MRLRAVWAASTQCTSGGRTSPRTIAPRPLDGASSSPGAARRATAGSVSCLLALRVHSRITLCRTSGVLVVGHLGFEWVSTIRNGIRGVQVPGHQHGARGSSHVLSSSQPRKIMTKNLVMAPDCGSKKISQIWRRAAGPRSESGLRSGVGALSINDGSPSSWLAAWRLPDLQHRLAGAAVLPGSLDRLFSAPASDHAHINGPEAEPGTANVLSAAQ